MTTTLARVRVVGGRLDPAGARQRLEGMLAATELRPAGLPPAALLFVRRVADLPPNALTLALGCVRPPPEWEAAFTSRLETALREAARPAHEAVPAGARAVVFADQAELLACLARDALDGTAAARWWWRSALARATSPIDAAGRAWCAAPPYVPAALELLAAWTLAPAFLRATDPGTVSALTVAVARAFSLPVAHAGAAGVPRAAPAPGRRGSPCAARAPWDAIAPEAGDPGLDSDRRLLLGVALALRRAPALARSPAFAQATRAWERDAERDSAPAPAAPSPAATGSHAASAPPATPAAGVRDHAEAPSRYPASRAEVAARRPPIALASPHQKARSADARLPPGPAPREQLELTDGLERAEDAAAVAPARSRRRPSAVANSAAGALRPSRPPHARAVEPPARAAPAPPAPVPHGAVARVRAPAAPGGRESRAIAPARADGPPAPATEPEAVGTGLPVDIGLGGLLYLLNLALQLDLYGDFTRPRDPGIALNPFELVELLGLRLLRERPRDPAWGLLAALAGRPRSAPLGRGFRPPSAWRVPPDWLAPPDGGGTWRWSASGRVLRIMHPAGFAVVAVPRSAKPPAEQLRRELAWLDRRHVTHGAPVRAALPREPARPLARWVARLAAYAEARLRLALALDSGERVDETLIRRRARVFVTPTHIDVVLKLAELPIGVRIAGLDRSPGWIPATGRHVAFHFE